MKSEFQTTDQKTPNKKKEEVKLYIDFDTDDLHLDEVDLKTLFYREMNKINSNQLTKLENEL